MAKNKLDKYIKRSKKGDKNAYRVIIAELYDEIHNLAAFIYDDDETQDKLTKHLFIKAYKNIAEYDDKEYDIHLWMAREAVKEIYKVISERESDIFPQEIDRAEYGCESIEDDDELGEASAEFNEGFLTSEGFDGTEDCFASLTMGEKCVYLLYCYVGYTIDEIEDICDIDSSFITSEIAKMRVGVLEAYAPLKAELTDALDDGTEGVSAAGVAAAGATGAAAGSTAGRRDAAAGDAGEDGALDYDMEAAEFDEDIDIYNDEKPVGKKGAAAGSDEVFYQIGPLSVSEKQFKGLIVGVIAVAVAIVIIGIVAFASSNSRRNNSDSATTTNAAITTATQATTTEAPTEAATEETTEEETTTARRVQSGTLPDVEINTTEAPTEPTTAAATTAAPTTAAATTTAAQNETTTTTKQETTSTQATTEASTEATTQATTEASTEASTQASVQASAEAPST